MNETTWRFDSNRFEAQRRVRLPTTGPEGAPDGQSLLFYLVPTAFCPLFWANLFILYFLKIDFIFGRAEWLGIQRTRLSSQSWQVIQLFSAV